MSMPIEITVVLAAYARKYESGPLLLEHAIVQLDFNNVPKYLAIFQQQAVMNQ